MKPVLSGYQFLVGTNEMVWKSRSIHLASQDPWFELQYYIISSTLLGLVLVASRNAGKTQNKTKKNSSHLIQSEFSCKEVIIIGINTESQTNGKELRA